MKPASEAGTFILKNLYWPSAALLLSLTWWMLHTTVESESTSLFFQFLYSTVESFSTKVQGFKQGKVTFCTSCRYKEVLTEQ